MLASYLSRSLVAQQASPVPSGDEVESVVAEVAGSGQLQGVGGARLSPGEVARAFEKARAEFGDVFDVLRYVHDGFDGFTVAQEMLLYRQFLLLRDRPSKVGGMGERGRLSFSTVLELADLVSVHVDSKTKFLFKLQFTRGLPLLFVYNDRERVVQAIKRKVVSDGTHEVVGEVEDEEEVEVEDEEVEVEEEEEQEQPDQQDEHEGKQSDSDGPTTQQQEPARERSNSGSSSGYEAPTGTLVPPSGRKGESMESDMSLGSLASGEEEDADVGPKVFSHLEDERPSLSFVADTTKPAPLRKRARSSLFGKLNTRTRWFRVMRDATIAWSSKPDGKTWKRHSIVAVKASPDDERDFVFITPPGQPNIEVRAQDLTTKVKWMSYVETVLSKRRAARRSKEAKRRLSLVQPGV